MKLKTGNLIFFFTRKVIHSQQRLLGTLPVLEPAISIVSPRRNVSGEAAACQGENSSDYCHGTKRGRQVLCLYICVPSQGSHSQMVSKHFIPSPDGLVHFSLLHRLLGRLISYVFVLILNKFTGIKIMSTVILRFSLIV